MSNRAVVAFDQDAHRVRKKGSGVMAANEERSFLMVYALLVQAVTIISRLIGRGIIGTAEFPYKLLRRMLGKAKAKPETGVAPVPS